MKVVGGMGFETRVLLREGAAVQYYREKAGGFTRRNGKDRVVVQHTNGETGRDGYFNRKLDAASVIHVPHGPKPIDIIGLHQCHPGHASIGIALILSIQALSH